MGTSAVVIALAEAEFKALPIEIQAAHHLVGWVGGLFVKHKAEASDPAVHPAVAQLARMSSPGQANVIITRQAQQSAYESLIALFQGPAAEEATKELTAAMAGSGLTSQQIESLATTALAFLSSVSAKIAPATRAG